MVPDTLEEGNTILKDKKVFGITCTNKKLRVIPHPGKRFSSVSVGGNNKYLVIFFNTQS